MTIQAKDKFANFKGLDGEALNNGYVYIGTSGLNPETNSIAIYSDYAMTIPVPQPLRTVGGYIVYNGKPINIFVGSDYSITVRDSDSSLVYSSLSGNIDTIEQTLLDLADGTTPIAVSANYFTIADGTDETKLIGFDASAITTGTTRTITMPDADVDLGDIAGLANGTTPLVADTSTFTIVDSVDETKVLDFDTSSITTGTTRTITMPDADIDLGILSGVTATGTDLNKTSTLDSGTWSPTLTPVTNVSSATNQISMYQRIGSIVNCSCRILIQPTSTGATNLNVSIPVNSTVALSETNTSGFGYSSYVQTANARVVGIGTNIVQIVFTTTSTGNHYMNINFSYLVQ